MLFVGCQNSTAFNSLHCSIRSKVEANCANVCGFDTPRAPRNCSKFVCWSRFSRRLRFSLRTHTSVLLYSDIYIVLAIILSDSGERMHRDKIPPQQMHAACRIVTRGSCCTKRFAEFNGNCESYCSLEQLVACYAPHTRENRLPVCIIQKQKAAPENTCTDHQVCCIVGGALGLE